MLLPRGRCALAPGGCWVEEARVSSPRKTSLCLAALGEAWFVGTGRTEAEGHGHLSQAAGLTASHHSAPGQDTPPPPHPTPAGAHLEGGRDPAAWMLDGQAAARGPAAHAGQGRAPVKDSVAVLGPSGTKPYG